MVSVEITDEQLRASLAGFLDANFGGSVRDGDTSIELDFRQPGISTDTELRLVERLLRQWHTREHPWTGTEIALTATATGRTQSCTQQLRLLLTPRRQ